MKKQGIYQKNLRSTQNHANSQKSLHESMPGKLIAESGRQGKLREIPLFFKITLASIALASFAMALSFTMQSLAPDARDLDRLDDLTQQFSFMQSASSLESSR